MTVTVNQKIYQMGPKLFESLVQAAKEKFSKDGKFAIVAAVKGEVWAMDNKTYPDLKSLDKAVRELRKRGLQVKTVRG